MMERSNFKTNRTAKGPSITAVSVAIGAISLLITSNKPGGLSGGEGFILGTVCTMIVLLILALKTQPKIGNFESQKSPSSKTDFHCPNCGVKLSVKKDTNFHKGKN